MKQSFKKIGVIIMSFVVLLSTMSFTVNQHYCGDKLVGSALFSKAESCGMEMPQASVQKGCSIQTKNCCKDIVLLIEGQNELKTEMSTISFDQHVFVASFIYAYVNLFEGLENNIIPFKNYTPPILVCDIQVMDQVFII